VELTLIQKVIVFALPVLLAITLHEAAHGYVAMNLGDKTAWMMGRVTANPLKHIDPVGTIGLPLILLLMSKLAGGPAFLFGWAKPVPVNFNNLRHPKRDMMWVAAAGPGANLIMALLWAAMIQLGQALGGTLGVPLMLMGAAGVFMNAILAALNLLPIPPLDGGRIAVSLLPPGPSRALARVEPYGFFILIALMLTGLLGKLMWPLMGLVFAFSTLLTGVSDQTLLSLISMLLK
jgi:Zn-dependent protease